MLKKDLPPCEQLLSNDDLKDDYIKEPYRLLELYSGIGGIRYSLKAAGIPFKVVAAIDINPVVNSIYKYNFGSHEQSQRNLLSFTASEIENMKVDIITMSPPCQPFTRVGLKKDINDARSSSFLHILSILTKLDKKPQYLFLENVQGFEDSDARNCLIKTLEECGYRYQEFLLSPLDLSIPNSRLRYYLIAKLRNLSFSFTETQQIFCKLPHSVKSWKHCCQHCLKKGNTGDRNVCPLTHFLEKKSTECFKPFLLPDHVLLNHWTAFDIVTEDDCSSCCFTKAYGRYAKGTGSVLCSLPKSTMSDIFENASKLQDPNERLCLLRELKLRYFTPKEIANLMCFPSNFDFPEHISTPQKYKSLGNSVNVFVVACLMQLLVQNKKDTSH